MYTQTHTHLKFSAGLYTHIQLLKSPLDVTQATTKNLLGPKLTGSSSFPPDILIFYYSPSQHVKPSSTLVKIPGVNDKFPFPSRPASLTCLLSNPSSHFPCHPPHSLPL